MRKSYIKYIALSVLFFSTISVVYQIAVVENPHFTIYDLCVNLLSEFAGMVFTVLIFNEFITYRQKLHDTNKLRSLYIELDALVKSIDFPFRAAAEACMDSFSGELWDKQTINTLRDRIILTQVGDCVFPAVPWYMIFSMQGDKIIRKCESIRSRYLNILEPQIADDLFYLTSSSEMLTDLTHIKIIYENDLLLHYTRPQNLGSYFACPTDHDFEIIGHMHSWIQTHQQDWEKQAAGMGRYMRRAILVITAIFAIGAAGYFINGSYFFGGLHTGVAALLCAIYFRYYRKKANKQE